jgi:hypothetical protein
MKKLFFLMLTSLIMRGQNNSSYEQNTQMVNAEASIIIPFGNLTDKFDYAQCYGVWINLGKDKGVYANFGVNLIFLKDARAVNYTQKDTTYTIDSDKFGLDFGFKAVKLIDIRKNDKKDYLEIDTAIGFHYLDYDFPSRSEEEEKKDPSFRNTTFLIAPEIKYIYDNIGLKFQYRYTPYNVIQGFESNFGSHSISFGIVYKQ